MPWTRLTLNSQRPKNKMLLYRFLGAIMRHTFFKEIDSVAVIVKVGHPEMIDLAVLSSHYFFLKIQADLIN